ncbi:MAG: PEP-CTERM sorting domain-containing protein [Akkermansiaceae bacterium]
MKYTLITLFATVAISQAAIVALEAGGGSFVNSNGVTVTYSFTSNAGIIDHGSGDIETNSNTGTGTTTLVFSESVTLYIGNTVTGSYGNSADAYSFSTETQADLNAGSTFTADEGAFVYDASGNVRTRFEVATTGSTAELYGNRATYNGTRNVAAGSGISWGKITGTSVQTITWTAGVARESFNFTVDTVAPSTTVPEPSSVALLSLSGLALLARRKRS